MHKIVLVYCDIAEKQSSYDNIVGFRQFSTPSKLLAVVPSQHYPVLRMKSHQRSFLSYRSPTWMEAFQLLE